MAGELRLGEPMSRHTTFRIGGPADAWIAPSTVGDVRALVAWCTAEGIPVHAVGGGSNLLVRDGGVSGVVLSTRHLARIVRAGPVTWTVEAGVATGKLLAEATKANLGGVEFLAGVPGSVGGALVMNAGTTLGAMTDVTSQVSSLRIGDGSSIRRTRDECGFAYRRSTLPADEIVLEARLELHPRPRAEIESDVRALRERRAAREPRGAPNAGSIFKNPPGVFAGKLIEDAGLKGRRLGGAEISSVHANWIVNVDNARAADVTGLAEIARAAVAQRFGVELELELKIMGVNE